MKYLTNLIGLSFLQFPVHIFGPVFALVMMLESNGITNSIATGIAASLVALAGTALHVWYSNRKLGLTTGLERDKQVDDRTIRLFDNMEEHYKELIKDKDNMIREQRVVIKQKDVLIEGHRQLTAASVVAANLSPLPTLPEPPPSV